MIQVAGGREGAAQAAYFGEKEARAALGAGKQPNLQASTSALWCLIFSIGNKTSSDMISE